MNDLKFTTAGEYMTPTQDDRCCGSKSDFDQRCREAKSKYKVRTNERTY